MNQQRLRVLIGAAAVTSAATLTVLAPAAHATPIGENTIKSECKAAGGTYGTQTFPGKGGPVRSSYCVYKDVGGGYHTDSYTNGTYTGTASGDGTIT